jgi:DNA (cytosine-5)-methyltransferase 1
MPIDPAEPMRTVTSHDREGLISVHIDKYFAGGYQGCGNGADEPLSTATVQPRHGLAATHLVKFKGTNLGQSPEDPLQTVTASAGEFAECRTVLAKARPGADLGYWPQIRSLLNEYCGYEMDEDDVLVLEIKGAQYFIRDILLRMLAPRELYNAMGFPADYIIDHDYKGNQYGKTKQVARCGNAVCPPMAEAVVRANLPEWCGGRIETMEQLNGIVAV